MRNGWRSRADDGPGFDPASTPRHHGLTRFTEESLTPLGVGVDIRSGVGRGTVVSLHGRGDRVGVVDPVPTRFGAWRRRPTGGSARAEWIVDLARAALVLTLFVSLAAATAAAGGGASSSYPLVSVAVSWTVSLLLVGSWWARRQPATVSATVISLSGVVVGAAVSAVAASGATVGSKIGLFVANWSCMYLASVRPDWSWRIVPLGVVQGVVLGLSDPSGGVITSMWVITGVLVTADLVRSWREFGAAADADRARALLAERRRAAELLRRQIRAMHLAGSPAAEGLVAEVSREVSAFLRTPPASSRASDPRSFPSAPGVEATDAARRVVEALSSMPGVSVDMRTTPEADTADAWRISLLATGLPPRQPLPALEAPAGCAWRTASLPGGAVRLVLAPLPAAG